MKFHISLIIFAVFVLFGTLNPAQGEEKHSTDQAAKELLNPNTSLASLTFRNQFRWYDGDLPDADGQNNYSFLFQPVFPLILGKTEAGAQKKLFIRPAIPIVIDQPYPTMNSGTFAFDEASGLADIGYDIAYGLSWPDGKQFAAGVVGSLPTATGDVPGGNTTLGPEIFTGIANKHGFFGALINHQWGIDSWSDSDVNKSTLQPIITFALPDNWAAGTIPIMSYDWEDDQATIPLNLFIQKTVGIMETPTRLQLEVNYYPDSWRSDAFGPEWFIGVNITPVVKNPFQALISGKEKSE